MLLNIFFEYIGQFYRIGESATTHARNLNRVYTSVRACIRAHPLIGRALPRAFALIRLPSRPAPSARAQFLYAIGEYFILGYTKKHRNHDG